MESITLIQDLAVVMTVAAVITVLCRRFRVPVVLGYIVAGLIIGPHTPPFPLIKDTHSIETLSELGIVFLLFAIGLEFSLSKLMKVGLVAFVAATLEIVLMIAIGYGLGQAFGWSFIDSLFLGAILSISSTTIIAKVLMESGKVNAEFAQVILGILIIEDLLAIVIIAMLSGLAVSGQIALDTALQSALKVGVFTVSALAVGFLTIPRLLRYAEKAELPETYIVSVLGLCFAGALAAVKFGFSVALGAFLVGAIIAETKQVKKVIHQIEPIRDMFTAVFFVAVGMMIDPSILAEYAVPIAVITAVTILGKITSCSLAAFLSGYRPGTSLMVGLGLAQIGEFSFIIASLGESTQVTSRFLYPIAVSVSAITTLTTPFLMQKSEFIIGLFQKAIPKPLVTFMGLYTSRIAGLRSGSSKPSQYSLWNQLMQSGRVHERIEKLIAEIINPDEAEPSKPGNPVHDELARLIREEYPWEMETMDFVVPLHESAINQSLSALRLRSETGATIAGIYRDTESLPNPPADAVLLAGDVLLILGSQEQIRSAIQFLHNKAKQPLPQTLRREGTPKTRTVKITAGSPLTSKTVGEIKLKRKSGAMILGIQKENRVIHNPGSDTLIEEGDTLILFGWPDELDAAEKFLTA